MNIHSKFINSNPSLHTGKTGPEDSRVQSGKPGKSKVSAETSASGAPLNNRSLKARVDSEIHFKEVPQNQDAIIDLYSECKDDYQLTNYFTDEWNQDSIRNQIHDAFGKISSRNDGAEKISLLAKELVVLTAQVVELKQTGNHKGNLEDDQYDKISLGATACLQTILEHTLSHLKEHPELQDECIGLLKDVTNTISNAIENAKGRNQELVDILLGTLKNAFQDDFTDEIDSVRAAGNELLPIFGKMYQQFAGVNDIQNKIVALCTQAVKNAVKAEKLGQEGALKEDASIGVAKIIVDAYEKELSNTKELITTAAKYDANTKGETIYRSIWNFIKSSPGASYRKSKELLTTLGLKIERFGGKVRNLPVIRQSVDQLEVATAHIKKKAGGAFSRKRTPKLPPKKAQKTTV